MTTELPQRLTFDEMAALSYRTEDGTLMVPNYYRPYLPNGEIDYVPMPTVPKETTFPCYVVPTTIGYVPAKVLWQSRFTHYTEFKRWLKNNERVVRTQHPSPRRLLIDASDWHSYWAEYDRRQSEGLDLASIQEFLDEARSVTDGIRGSKRPK